MTTLNHERRLVGARTLVRRNAEVVKAARRGSRQVPKQLRTKVRAPAIVTFKESRFRGFPTFFPSACEHPCCISRYSVYVSAPIHSSRRLLQALSSPQSKLRFQSVSRAV